MTEAEFEAQLRAARERAAALHGRAAADPDALAAALEELGTAFEELTVAQEELRAQADVLAAAEARAAADRDLYRDLFEFAPNGYAVTDSDGVVVRANRAAVALLGGPGWSLAGAPLADYVWAGDRPAFDAHLAALHAGEPAWERPLAVRLIPRGDLPAPRTADVSVVPYRDPDNRRVMFRWQLRDVTEQWRAAREADRLRQELELRVVERTADLERELRAKAAAEARLTFLSDSSALFATSLDVGEVLAHVARRAVPALADWCFAGLAEEGGGRWVPLAPGRLTAFPAVEPAADRLPGRVLDVPDVAAPPAGLAAAEAAVVRAFAAADWRAGLWLPMVAAGEPVGGLALGAGRPHRWSAADRATAADFARQAAAALRNAELHRRLRDVDRRKDEFIATLAHELRNPLAPIRNAVHVLRHSTPPDDRARWAVDILDRQVRRVGRLVDDLLDASRAALGKVRLDVQPVDLGAAAAAAAEAARPRADERGLRLSVDSPAGPVWAAADAGRLDQILGNLLDNAVKFTDPPGEVTVTVGCDGGRAVVRVRDTGVGLPPGAAARLFDLFAQGDDATGRADGGLGIGLALVRRLAELHGGAAEAHSDGPGTGSEFVVRLPLAGPDGIEPSPSSS
jgi:PAS domain S-box-containing protein